MKNERAILERVFQKNLSEEILEQKPQRNFFEEGLSDIEYISKNEEEISPILKMNEDQILDFVENFDVSLLSKLTVKELNYIGEVLGVEPEILFGFKDED